MAELQQKKKRMNAAMEKEKSNCQILMTRSLQWERDEDWVGAGGRREARAALSTAEFLEARVERGKTSRSS